jgi:hypothetical protein
MTDNSSNTIDHDPPSQDKCANCDGALSGPFCSACGQSSEDVQRPAWVMLSDLFGSVLAWEGRFLTTVRSLYTSPGSVPRRYTDGQRTRFTAPVRLYLIISLLFFTLTSQFGIRPIAVQMRPSAELVHSQSAADLGRRLQRVETRLAQAEPVNLAIAQCAVSPGPDEILPDGRLRLSADNQTSITIFAIGDAPESRVVSPSEAQCLQQALTAASQDAWVASLLIEAARNPAKLENTAATAAGQAVIFMVFVLALLNAVLHPRSRLIEHVILSLYFHAMALPVFAAIIILANLFSGNVFGNIITPVSGAAYLLGQTILCDRRFYRSSWFGAVLRALVIVAGYLALVLATSLGLIFFGLSN